MTHLSPGMCWPRKGGKIAYSNRALGTGGNVVELADVWGEIDRYADAVNDLLGIVFHELKGTLKAERVTKTCGLNEDGFLYQCSVSPQEALDFDAGGLPLLRMVRGAGQTHLPHGGHMRRLRPSEGGVWGIDPVHKSTETSLPIGYRRGISLPHLLTYTLSANSNRQRYVTLGQG